MAQQSVPEIFAFDFKLPEKTGIVSIQDAVKELNAIYSAFRLFAGQIGGRVSVIFDAAVVPGDVVNLLNSGGTLHAEKALANTKLTKGIVVGAQSFGIGDTGEVQCGNLALFPLGTLVPGSVYYTSAAVAGTVTSVAPAAGSRQRIGFAITAEILFLNPELVFS